MHQLIIDRINALVGKYKEDLTERGIKCSVSKRYFESNTPIATYASSNIFSMIDRYFAVRRENKKYKHQNNRYHAVVLCFLPTEKNLLKDAACKEYAFLLSKIERIEEGYAPKNKIFKEEKILNKIEKLIKKILRKAEKKSAKQVCKEAWYDVFRYIFNYEYGYKKCIFGKDRFVWELLFSGIVLGIIIAICVTLFLVTK